jgi:hypothetical protein
MKLSFTADTGHVYHSLHAQSAQGDAYFGGDPFIGVHYIKVGLCVLVFLALLPALVLLSTLAYSIARAPTLLFPRLRRLE